MKYHDIHWKTVIECVSKAQEDIAMAAIKNENQKVKELVQSFECRPLAIRRVSTNVGNGVDKELWDTHEIKYAAIGRLGQIVHHTNDYKASPVRRIWIPKPGTTEKRPLAIPTMIDRAVQAAYHAVVDPAIESKSDLYSYGFRKGR